MIVNPYLELMAEKNASDLFFTSGAFVSMKINGVTQRISKAALQPGVVKKIAYEIMDEQQISEFEETKEMNLGISVGDSGRYRVNIYYQRGEVSMVIRYINSEILSIEKLGLPPVLSNLVMRKNGLILVVGSTGSGKSTTLASMIEHRNTRQSGHILTIEDPIEYAFTHKKSIVGQREVGLDTLSYGNALREAMREAPDVIMIGEVRDRNTMEAAMAYANTGHLCITTLHAVNANQALDRATNFFPIDSKNQVLMDLSLNLAGIISQRLVPCTDGGRVPAVEVLVNTPYIEELISKGEFSEIKSVMEKGAAVGMQTFDQCLHDLFKMDKITLDDALNFADSRSNLEWQINFGGESEDKGSRRAQQSKLILNEDMDADHTDAPTLTMPVPDLDEEPDNEKNSQAELDQDLIADELDDEFFNSTKSRLSDD